MRINPNKYIRKGALKALEFIGVPVWAKKIPKDINPNKYVLIQSQSKNRAEISKEDWEWTCVMVFDIVAINETGYSSTHEIDDLEEFIINGIETNFKVEGFHVKDISLQDSIDLDTETGTQSIERRILTYSFWLCQKG